MLAQIPPDTTDEFMVFAIDELDAQIVERVGGGRELLRLCRYLLEPPRPQPEHAARLAGADAANDAIALGFLWALYTHSAGTGSDAAGEQLSEVATSEISSQVEAEVHELLRRTDDPEQRAVLMEILEHPSPGGRGSAP